MRHQPNERNRTPSLRVRDEQCQRGHMDLDDNLAVRLRIGSLSLKGWYFQEAIRTFGVTFEEACEEVWGSMEGSALLARPTDSPSRLSGQQGQANAMLRLSKALSLEHDIFPKIPKQQILIRPPQGEMPAQELNFLRCNMGVVGQEREGIILLARHGYVDGVRCYFLNQIFFWQISRWKVPSSILMKWKRENCAPCIHSRRSLMLFDVLWMKSEHCWVRSFFINFPTCNYAIAHPFSSTCPAIACSFRSCDKISTGEGLRRYCNWIIFDKF